jgi:hypothetical protein
MTTITTVSHYMKHLIWAYGVNPMFIPNGIPRNWLHPCPAANLARLRERIGRGRVLTKVARWDPDKRRIMAVETVAALKARGHYRARLGGTEPTMANAS